MNLNNINENVNRLLSNIWAIITFLKQYCVDGSKDVSIKYTNADGSESVKTFPNIAKQINNLDNFKDSFKKDLPLLPNLIPNTKYWEGAEGSNPPKFWHVRGIINNYTIKFTRIPIHDANISKTGTIAYKFGVNDVKEFRKHNMIGYWREDSYNYGADFYALGIEIIFNNSSKIEGIHDSSYLLIAADCNTNVGWARGNDLVWNSIFINILEIPNDGNIELFHNRGAGIKLTNKTNGWVNKINSKRNFGGCGQHFYVKPVKDGTYKFAIALPYISVGDHGNTPRYAGAISQVAYTHDDFKG